ncbi:nucleotide pyrophosphohydrolase, partial [Staphylococcus agnetis]
MTHHITIIGLGNYCLDDLPLGIYRFLQNQSKIYVRTKAHPVIAELQNIDIESFDAIYEQHDTFEPVYDAITDQLLQRAQTEDVVYAVPGHPRVAETTTQLLFQKAAHYDVV